MADTLILLETDGAILKGREKDTISVPARKSLIFIEGEKNLDLKQALRKELNAEFHKLFDEESDYWGVLSEKPIDSPEGIVLPFKGWSGDKSRIVAKVIPKAAISSFLN